MSSIKIPKRTCQHCYASHPDNRHLLGKDFSFQFDGGVKSNDIHGTCELKGKLDSLVTFGDILHQDVGLIEHEEKVGLKWCVQEGMNIGSKLFNSTRNRKNASLSSKYAAGVPLSEARLMVNLNFLFSTVGTIFTDLTFETEELELVLGFMMRAMRGYMALIDPDQLTQFPWLTSICHAISSVREQAESYGVSIRFFVHRFNEYLRYYGFGSKGYLENSSSVFPKISKVLRQMEGVKMIGCYPSLEAAYICHRLEIPTVIREHPLYSLLADLTCKHMYLTNEILSFKFKTDKHAGNTNVILLAKSECQTLQDAFDQIIQEVNETAILWKHVKQTFVSSFPNDETVLKITKLLVNLANGQIEYFAESELYNDFKVNWIVQEN